MTDENPRPRARKLALVGPVVIAAIVVGLLLAAWLMRDPKHSASESPAPAPSPSPATTPIEPQPSLPVSLAPLSRAEIIQYARAAASTFAMRAPSPPDSSSLIGRQFQLRLPFGCGGPLAVGSTGQAFAEYDAEGRTIRLVARPSDLTQLPLIQSAPNAKDVERAEGFWISRPWIDVEACPPRDDGPAPATPTPPATQTLGIAQLFETGGSRVLQRGDRPYEFSRKAPEGDPALLSHSYRLVLEGRMVGFGDGQVLRCWSESPDHRPVCLYAVALDRVAFEDGEDGEVLAEWRE